MDAIPLFSQKKRIMNQWHGKIAVITGASSGIGAAIAINLANAGMRVIGLARRVERVEKLKKQLSTDAVGEINAHKCDVTSESDIKTIFHYIENTYGSIDVLINNAGIGSDCNIVDANNTDKLRAIIDTNLTAVALCTREAFQLMQKHNIDGHIIIINSILGHCVPHICIEGLSLGMYPASKFGVSAMTEVLRQEFQLFKSKTKITVRIIFTLENYNKQQQQQKLNICIVYRVSVQVMLKQKLLEMKIC